MCSIGVFGRNAGALRRNVLGQDDLPHHKSGYLPYFCRFNTNFGEKSATGLLLDRWLWECTHFGFSAPKVFVCCAKVNQLYSFNRVG